MLEYGIFSQHLSAHGSTATAKRAEIALDTDLDGREDAFNPAELLPGTELTGQLLRGKPE